MIPAELYHDVFLFVVTLLSLICFFRYSTSFEPIDESPISTFILMVGMVIFFGFRPLSIVFVDMGAYDVLHNLHLYKPFVFSWDVENVIWDNFDYWTASMGLNSTYLFVFLALCFFGVRYAAYVRLFPNNSWIAYLFFLGAYLTFAAATNGMKAGVASSFLSLAIAYRGKWPVALAFLLIMIGFHHAYFVCAVAYAITFICKNTRLYLIFWVFALLISALHITYFQELFSSFTDESGEGYLSVSDSGYRTGFRLDFILYSVVPIIEGWYIINVKKYEDKLYTFILNLYILLNGVWMLCMYASFTNRIASLSWGLYTLVVCYPFLSSKLSVPDILKNKWVANALLLNLGFTLFMIYIF